jgi:uncharacterized protein
MFHEATHVKIEDPTLLIRINRLYRSEMSAEELYDATRGVWRIGEKRKGAVIALALFRGIVHEAYEIHSWHPAGSTVYKTRPPKDVAIPGRWEFLGSVASEAIRGKYVGHSVKEYLPPHSQAPVIYVNVPKRTADLWYHAE